MRQPLLSQKSGPLSGRIAAPGDKSISHRALILGALSMGTSRITGLLQADDVMATAAALVQLGAKVRKRAPRMVCDGPRRGRAARRPKPRSTSAIREPGPG